MCAAQGHGEKCTLCQLLLQQYCSDQGWGLCGMSHWEGGYTGAPFYCTSVSVITGTLWNLPCCCQRDTAVRGEASSWI